MLIASCDFNAIHSAVAGIPTMLAIIWSIFCVLPLGIVAARGLQAFKARISPANVKTGRNGRLYAVVAGRPPVWARRGESAFALATRAASL